MIRFMSKFTFAYRSLTRFLSRGALARAGILRTISLRPGSLSHVSTFIKLKVWIYYVIGAQFVFLLLLGLISIVLGKLTSTIPVSWMTFVTSYLPFDLPDLYKLITYIATVNIAWLALVTFNHFTDVYTMFLQINDQSFFGILGVLSSYYYVTCWSMGYEFFVTLFSAPMNIGETKAIGELILAYGYWGQSISDLGQWILSIAPLYTRPWLNAIGGCISDGWTWSAGYILYAVKSAWTYSVGTVATTITPDVPNILQPYVNSTMYGVAKIITGYIVIKVVKIAMSYFF